MAWFYDFLMIIEISFSLAPSKKRNSYRNSLPNNSKYPVPRRNEELVLSATKRYVSAPHLQ